jgi:lycopene cyclase domain-containing protein
MLPPVAASLVGGLLAFAPGAGAASGGGPAAFDPLAAGLHAGAVFCAVYTAHVKDGYVDFHRRGEDADHPLTVTGCRAGLAAASAAFAACTAGLWVVAGPLAALLTLPTWVIGYLHAPQLDTHPAGATLGYPVGIALAVCGGVAAQSGVVGALPAALAAVLLVVLTGVKIVDDAGDLDYDRSIRKRTVAVALGPERARRVADGLFLAGGVCVLWLTIGGPFPASAPLAPVAFGVVALAARRAAPERATMLLVRGAYVLLALLVAAVWFRPLAGVPLPDVGVLGPHTYLATEVAFGSVALALLVRAGRGALWRAGRTIARLYPVAYVWDWYTLTVGVFSIPLRTGVEVAGLPLEEHLFMLVVPALVLGIHETLARDADGGVR